MPIVLNIVGSFFAKYWWEVLIAVIIGGLILVVKIDHYEIKHLKADLAIEKTNFNNAEKEIDVANKAVAELAKQGKADRDAMDQLGKDIQQRNADQAAAIAKLQKQPAPTNRLKFLQDGLAEINKW